MWNENIRSPSACTGETNATSRVRMPVAKSAIRQPGTGVPRSRSVSTRRVYNAAATSVGTVWSGSSVQLVLGARRAIMSALHLFHYHLGTSKAREGEARYVGTPGLSLGARHGSSG